MIHIKFNIIYVQSEIQTMVLTNAARENLIVKFNWEQLRPTLGV